MRAAFHSFTLDRSAERCLNGANGGTPVSVRCATEFAAAHENRPGQGRPIDTIAARCPGHEPIEGTGLISRTDAGPRARDGLPVLPGRSLRPGPIRFYVFISNAARRGGYASPFMPLEVRQTGTPFLGR